MRRLSLPPALRSPLVAIASAALPIAAIAALLSSTSATRTRYFDVEELFRRSPWLTAQADGTLPGGCQITARVSDDAGAVAAAPLRLVRVDGEGSVEEWNALADKKGAHRFIDLPRGVYHLTALVDGKAPQGMRPFVCGGVGERGYVELPLVATGTVARGSVLDLDKHLVPGAELVLEQEAGERESLIGVVHVPVAADGSYTVPLAPGRYTALVQAPGYAPVVRKLLVDDQEGYRASFRVAFAPRIAGRVVDTDGQPVAGALVALGGVFDPRAKVSRAITGDDGAFSLPVQPTGDLEQIVVTVRGTRADGQAVVAVRSFGGLETPRGTLGVELEAAPGRTVSGTLLDDEGRPMAFGEVRYRIRALGLTGVEHADGQGHFAIDGMPQSADVEVWAEGSAVGAWGAQVASPGSDLLALTFVAPSF